MASALHTFGRILARHWPALVAWYLGGAAVHLLLVQLAGFVGGRTTLGGLLILPLAVAAKLVAFVAMYLTVRPSLSSATAGTEAGWREFTRAILASILPFFAFYSAWGMLDADIIEFAKVASAIALRDSGYDLDVMGDRGGIISVSALPVTVLVIALVVRLLLSRLRERLPSWTVVLAAYAEVLWTFMLFTLVGQWMADVREWLSARVGASWVQRFGDWFAVNVVPVAGAWEAAQWLIALLAGVVLMPAAWLAVAGVIYGTTFVSEPASIERAVSALQGPTAALSRAFVQRFENLWAAVAVIWRGGPALFGAAVLAYAVWAFVERFGTRAVLQLIGGHETWVWTAFLPLIAVAVAAVAEPLRVALVATAYDAVIARPQAGLDAGRPDISVPSGLDSEADDLIIVAGNVEQERAVRILGDEEDGHNLVGR